MVANAVTPTILPTEPPFGHSRAAPGYLSSVDTVLWLFDGALGVVRLAFLSGALVTGALCAVEWGVRSRRLTPFSAPARAARTLAGPLIAPVERRILRAGGTPASAPWWTLAAVVIGGVIVLSALDFVRAQLGGMAWALNNGPRGITRLLLSWTFGVMYIALLIRVVASWIQLNPYKGVVRLATQLTDPILLPIRSVLPTFGMIDLSPIAAYFLLRLLESFVLRLI
jgi:YggT family protein